MMRNILESGYQNMKAWKQFILLVLGDGIDATYRIKGVATGGGDMSGEVGQMVPPFWRGKSLRCICSIL